MLIELSETEPTYKKYLNYFFSCIEDKGPNYVVHKAIGQIKHQYIYRDDSNAMYTLLQTKLCAGMTKVERQYFSAIIQHLLANPNQFILEEHEDCNTPNHHSIFNLEPQRTSIDLRS